jgi:IclR family acetate operon transcriptional repressor
MLEAVSLRPSGRDVGRAGNRPGRRKELRAELTNGLLARGYLVEEDRRFHLGPGPFVLATRANKLAALSLDHQLVTELSNLLGCTGLIGVRVGDAMVFTDYAGHESPGLTFVARNHARRPSTRAPPARRCWPTSPTTR